MQAINVKRSYGYLSYLKKEKETACCHILSECLTLTGAAIANPKLNPTLHLSVEHRGFSFHIVRYGKDRWRVFSVNIELIRACNDPKDPTDAADVMFASNHHDFKNLEEVIRFIKT